jgi:hypothetical protein
MQIKVLTLFLVFMCGTSPFLFSQTSPALLYGTYLGSIGTQTNVHSTLLPDGSIILFASTQGAEDLATAGAFMEQTQGGYDCWLTKLNADGTVIWSTYFGGSNNEAAQEVESDSFGNIYISGESGSNNLPVTSGAFQETPVGISHPFLAKFNSNGELIWCTFFDTITSADGIGDLKWSESDQRLYFLGYSFMTGLATSGAYYDFTGNGTNSLLASFTASGSLIYATYVPSQFGPNSIAVDPFGQVYLGCNTNQLVDINFEGAYKSVNEGHDGLVVRMDNAGWPQWGTYFGGDDYDAIYTIDCDAEGAVYFGGSTSSVSEIATPGAYQSTIVGINEGMVGKFSPDGELVWSTYFGTSSDWDGVSELYWGADNYLYLNMYITLPASLLVSPNTFQPEPGGGSNDQIIARITVGGVFQWVSFLGGEEWDLTNDISIMSNGEMLITGSTGSQNNFTTANAIQPDLEGLEKAFMMVFDPTYCVYGCTQPDAFNYNVLATCDDGSCLVPDGNDLNGDGVIDVQDLLLLIEEFGCLSDCLFDLDGDGIVGVQDLIIMMGEL